MHACIATAEKYFQKSLHAKDKTNAIDKVIYELARVHVLEIEGKVVCSPTVHRQVRYFYCSHATQKAKYQYQSVLQRLLFLLLQIVSAREQI